MGNYHISVARKAQPESFQGTAVAHTWVRGPVYNKQSDTLELLNYASFLRSPGVRPCTLDPVLNFDP